MAETPEDGGGDDAKLELPRLSIFRRRRKASDADRRAEDPGAPAPAEGAWDDTLTETPAPAVIPSPGLDDATDQTAEPEPASKPAATAETPVEPAATAETPVEPAATAE
ncbi:MAG: hypothetical protein ABI873_18385, partial [Marmoricola sp.]